MRICAAIIPAYDAFGRNEGRESSCLLSGGFP